MAISHFVTVIKRGRLLQLITYGREVIELIFMLGADDTETNMYEMPSVLC